MDGIIIIRRLCVLAAGAFLVGRHLYEDHVIKRRPRNDGRADITGLSRSAAARRQIRASHAFSAIPWAACKAKAAVFACDMTPVSKADRASPMRAVLASTVTAAHDSLGDAAVAGVDLVSLDSGGAGDAAAAHLDPGVREAAGRADPDRGRRHERQRRPAAGRAGVVERVSLRLRRARV